jgi:chromosome partitioning protein
MNRTLAIVNQKGGVGKTTISTNLGAALAKEGKRVLVVDMDPQSHCAVGMAVPEEQIDISVADWLSCQRNGKSVELAEIAWQILPNLELAPSQRSLSDFESAESNTEDGTTLLRTAIEAVRRQYDFIVVDCPPHLGPLMKNALVAADEVIIPVETGYFSLHGLTRQLETVEEIGVALNKRFEIRIVANQYDVRTKLAREILAELRGKFEGLVLNSVINFNTKLKEGASFGQPITEFAPGSMGARDFQALAMELIEADVTQEIPEDRVNAYADKLAENATRLLSTGVPLIRSDANGRSGGSEAEVISKTHMAPDRDDISPETELAFMTPGVRSDEATVTVIDIEGERAMREAVGRGESSLPQQPAAAGSQASQAKDDDLHDRIDDQLEAIYGVRQTPEGVVIRSRVPGAGEVQLAGDFNEWMPHKTPMRRIDRDGTFESTLRLEPGRYRYRLVVDGRWAYDRNNPDVETNEYGEINSVIDIRD